MAIVLEVEDYCQTCMDFTASVKPPHKEPHDWEPGYYLTDTVVQCKNRSRCASIFRHLKQCVEKEEAVG